MQSLSQATKTKYQKQKI